MLSLPGVSCREKPVIDFIRAELLAAGAPPDSLQIDDVPRRSRYQGEIGNLVFTLPGTVAGPRRMLMAHVDTVPICAGARPVRRGGLIVPRDRSTGLGADDRSGATAILAAALEILRKGLPHPPLTFLWTVQEELGLCGARHARLSLLGKPRMAFNFDGGAADKLTIGATGGYRMTIRIQGLASHAGNAPEQGISAITIAAVAIARLHADGWLGKVEKKEGSGTSNVGVIHGGEATNVVTPQLELRAEARSHDPHFRRRIIKAFQEAFREAVGQVPNRAGAVGKLRFEGHLDYEAFALPADEPAVAVAEAAVRAIGGQPLRAISNGGLDANWMSARGVPTVTLGCGQLNGHTTSEKLDLAEFRKACRIALLLATGAEE